MTDSPLKTDPAESAGASAASLRSDVAARLHGLLTASRGDDRELAPALEALAEEHTSSVYSDLLYLLSHLLFDPEEAKTHWRRIVEHRTLMEERLGSHVDLRVALASYFVQVDRKIDNPIIIEMSLFEEARASAYRDELTSLRNYRFLTESLPQEVLRSDQYAAPLTLIMLDIDGFKDFNDRHGHEAGNRALTTIGQIISETLREVDIAVRYGGEEFVLVTPSTPKIGGRLVAERVRKRIESHFFEGEGDGHGETLTVSLGVATYPADATSAAELIRVADRAMYHAKANGKNRVEIYGENRRSHRRVDVALEGRFGVYRADGHPLKTIDVSEGGVRFTTRRKVARGDLLDLRLRLPGSPQEIAFAGRVVQLREHPEGFEAAVRIIDMPGRDRHLLTSYLRRKTVKQASPA